MRAWEKIEQRRLIFVNRYEKVFREVLNKQVQPLFDAIDANFLTQYETLVPILINDAEIKEPFINLYQDVGVTFRDSLLISIEKSGVHSYRKKSLEDDVWAQIMADYAELVTLNRTEYITQTTRSVILNMTRDQLNEVDEAVMGVEQLATKIRNSLIEKYGVVEKYRARRIAQTEVLTASNYSSYTAARESGIPMKKRWLTAPYGIAKKERHNMVAGLTEQRPMITENFIVDNVMMMHPGDPEGGPEHTINCRCAIGYETF